MFSYHEIPVYDPRPHSSHTKTLRFIQDGMRVLDVGCATGYLARELKRKNCEVVGIEINRDMADIAAQYCKDVIVADVENIEELPVLARPFDVIIFDDILEHLRMPNLVLVNFKRYLKSDGVVIASVPNIARLEIRLKLLFGKFEYKERGILNKGHLRFFTLATAKKLFASTGYEIVRIEYTGLGSKFKILPTLLSSQFVIMAKASLAV
ncbi:MAG: class I SAM-dependent methyltransferase [bacterium]